MTEEEYLVIVNKAATQHRSVGNWVRMQLGIGVTPGVEGRPLLPETVAVVNAAMRCDRHKKLGCERCGW